MRKASIATTVALLLMAGEAKAQDPAEWALYRSSVVDDSARIHVATFYSRERAGSPGPSYNAGNCADAAELFQDQAGVTVRYWCEKKRA